MSRTREEETQAEVLVEWINSFNISHHCKHITDLSSGITLFEVLADIDSTWFKLIRSTDVGDNWVLKVNNLKKLDKLLSRYITEVLGEDHKKLPAVDLTKIAKDANFRELHKLCKLVLYVAVHCSRNQIYIEKIQELSEEKQHALMLNIHEVRKARFPFFQEKKYSYCYCC
ncbi:hypothetical protein F4703DRAFT_1166098 [Phycomyces blakesleeanus]